MFSCKRQTRVTKSPFDSIGPCRASTLPTLLFPRDDHSVDLFFAQLESIGGQEYRLTLPVLVADGEYHLQLMAEGSGIVDEADH